VGVVVNVLAKVMPVVSTKAAEGECCPDPYGLPISGGLLAVDAGQFSILKLVAATVFSVPPLALGDDRGACGVYAQTTTMLDSLGETPPDPRVRLRVRRGNSGVPTRRWPGVADDAA
jgi:hypothetical protein